MSTCNQMSSTANKVTMIRRIKKKKSFLKESQTQEAASIVHYSTNFLQPQTLSRPEVPRYMNSYRLESKNSFNCSLVYAVLEDVISKHCLGIKYDAVKCASKVQTIAGEILRRVKKFEFDRYRLIVFVEIGSNENHELNTSVKCMWDALKDKFVTYNLKSSSMFTSATCFGIYLD